MTVVEYDGAIVVVDVGLRFPTAEQVGIDLVLPDFTYLRERADDIEGIVITHGHEDHLGALPWILRELGTDIPVFGGPLTMAMARSKLDEHRLKDDRPQRRQAGRDARARAVRRRADPHDALDPGHDGRRADAPISGRCSSPATTSSTRRRSTASPPTSAAWPSWAARACCCCAATRPTPTARASRRASRSPARTSRRCSAAARAGSSSPASRRTSTASSRSSTRRPRTGARSSSSAARCARTSTSAGSLGHIDVPEGMLVQPREVEDFPDHKLVDRLDRLPGRAAERAAPHGPPRPSAGRAARRRHGRLRGDADPGQRARGQRDDRPALPHRLRRDHDRGRADPRLRPRLPGGDQADAQPDQADAT